MLAIAVRAERTSRRGRSRSELATDTGLHIDTVKKSLRRLARKGLINTSARFNDRGSRAANIIEIVGFQEALEVGDAVTQGWVTEDTQDGCCHHPGVGDANTPLYKEENKIEEKEEEKTGVRVADAREPTVDASSSKTASPDPLFVFNSYNELAQEVGLPLAAKLTPARRSAIRARQRECGGESWSVIAANVKRSAFLQGQNDRGWRPPGFDWFLKPANYVKVFEGQYGNGAHARSTRSDTAAQIRQLEALA